MRTFAVSCCLLILSNAAFAQAKRPLTHADYDIWNNITGMTLSPDGKYVAYTLSASKGDATFIVRNVAAGTEWKFTKGAPPAAAPIAPPTDDLGEDDDADQPRPGFPTTGGSSISGSPSFTPDSKFLYFVLTPTKAEVDKATAEKKKPEEMPKLVLAVLDLGTGNITQRITGVKSFSITGKDAGLLVMMKEPKPEAKPEPKPEAKPEPKPVEKHEVAPLPKKKDGEDIDQAPKTAEPAKPTETAPTPRPTTGSELVIRNLADGTEVTFADVQEYSITRDFSQILTTVASKKTDNNGVYFADLFNPDKAQALVKGAGRYYRLSWDEPQKQLAFFFDDAPPATAPTPANPLTPPVAPGTQPATQPRFGKGTRGGGAPTTAGATIPTIPTAKPKVYYWERPTKEKPFAAAVLLIGPETLGIKKGWQIVDRGGLSFTADGLKINVSTAPEPEKPAEPKKAATPVAAPTATPDKVELDLWHWKDEAIQPMQKVRAGVSRNRSFAAVYLLDAKKFIPLADEDRSLRAPEFGDWGVGSSDKKYRHQTWESPTAVDYSLVNVRTGESKSILTAARSGLSPSPKGTYLAGFDGKNWFTISVPDGRKTMLTAKLKPKFFNEEFDSPMTPPSYPQVGWSSDDKYFFVTDKHDIWKLAADGSEAVNVTEIGAAANLRFRLIRVEKPDDDLEIERERGLDTNKPWLLAADNLATRDTGFYRLTPGQKPKLLLMGPRNYGPPTKAKKADTMVLTVSTFTDFPDYFTTTPEFKEIKRLTDANPQRKQFNWATAELVHYSNTDGTHLSGILVKPENFDPSKKYPMVVYIYERFSNTFHSYREPVVRRGQVINPIWYASNGYLVLIPDIAYKVGHPGQSALQCVLPAIQTVVDRGCVNEKAIGINGQSWGGYQIAYMVTQTNRFKAAVAGAAVTNMTSAYNGIRWGSGMARQFQYERTQSRIGETLWQAPIKYIENSPVFMADRVQTPLMMINNDNDDAVPWYQGIEFYLSLRRLGKEVYMFNYNGEPHNLAKTVNARDFALRMSQFYDHHLKGAPMPPWMASGIPYLERDKEKEQWKKLFAPEIGKKE
ncbi:hypothetical protein BH11PLA2_BH11PLA2_04550 [soil metagenome]